MWSRSNKKSGTVKLKDLAEAKRKNRLATDEMVSHAEFRRLTALPEELKVYDLYDGLEEIEAKRLKAANWNNLISAWTNLGEGSNIGIVLQIVTQLIPAVLKVISAGTVTLIGEVLDMLIYVFKDLRESTRLFARARGITIEEEALGTHPKQNKADLASLVLFGLAVPFFVAGIAIASAAFCTTIGWCLALAGLSVKAHYEYRHQATTAKAHYHRVDELHKEFPVLVTQEMVKTAKKDYKAKKTSYQLLCCVITGLCFLFIIGSAAAFAPPMVIPALIACKYLASVFLGGINVGRLLNSIGKPYVERLREWWGRRKSKSVELEQASTAQLSSTAKVKQVNPTISVNPVGAPVAKPVNSSYGKKRGASDDMFSQSKRQRLDFTSHRSGSSKRSPR